MLVAVRTVMQAPTSGTSRIGPACGERSHGGERLPVRPKALPVLPFLLVHREQVISRGELRRVVLPRSSARSPRRSRYRRTAVRP